MRLLCGKKDSAAVKTELARRAEPLRQQFEQGPRRLHLTALRAMTARRRIPGVNVEMRPGLRIRDETLQEQSGGDTS